MSSVRGDDCWTVQFAASVAAETESLNGVAVEDAWIAVVSVVGSDGTVEVPRGPGIGFEIDRDYLEARTESVERFTLRSQTVPVS